jgi:hypothetical protein
MENKAPIIAVDFDGTITSVSNFPHIGNLMPNVQEVLQELHDRGSIIILWTCRGGDDLQRALDYCEVWGIPIDYCNRNIPEIEGKYGNPKIFANYYIDDLNLGGFPGWDKTLKIILQDKYFRVNHPKEFRPIFIDYLY